MFAFLNLVYRSIYLPIQYYKNEELLLQFPLESNAFHFVRPFLSKVIHNERSVNYIISKDFLYFGMVRNAKTREEIILGPISTTRVSSSNLPKIMTEYSIPKEHQDEVRNYFQITPAFSHSQFLHLLALIHSQLNQEIIDPFVYFEYGNDKSVNSIDIKHTHMLYDAKEEEFFHNSYQFEQQLYHYVETGNINALKAITSANITTGAIGENSLRREKNLLIACVTLLTRHSILGGLDIETAYQLSDAYIQESEKSLSMETVKKLIYTAIFDFTERVAASKIPQGMSPDIFKSIQYVSTHTNQPLSISDIAEAVGKSPSYLSKKFKNELGFNLSNFIMRRKLEEGKSLLIYSDKSISEISEYLCFSSQSYFQNVFKKKFGITPHEYRQSRK